MLFSWHIERHLELGVMFHETHQEQENQNPYRSTGSVPSKYRYLYKYIIQIRFNVIHHVWNLKVGSFTLVFYPKSPPVWLVFFFWCVGDWYILGPFNGPNVIGVALASASLGGWNSSSSFHWWKFWHCSCWRCWSRLNRWIWLVVGMGWMDVWMNLRNDEGVFVWKTRGKLQITG